MNRAMPLKPGEFMDEDTLKQRCPSCGAAKVKGRCPVGKKDCGRK